MSRIKTPAMCSPQDARSTRSKALWPAPRHVEAQVASGAQADNGGTDPLGRRNGEDGELRRSARSSRSGGNARRTAATPNLLPIVLAALWHLGRVGGVVR